MNMKLLINDLYNNLFTRTNVNYDTIIINEKILIEQIVINMLKENSKQ